jgi:hypothetical protein
LSPSQFWAHSTRLGRLIRDIGRKIEGHADIEAAFALPLARANQIRGLQQRQRGWKLYSFHAPETECIGKGKALRVRRQGLDRHYQCPRPGRPVRASCQGAARQLSFVFCL